MDWEFTLRIEGNPQAGGGSHDVVLGPVTRHHNGVAGGAPYTIAASIPIAAGTLPVAPEKAQSYEFILEVVGVDDQDAKPHGMAGFVDLGDVMVFAS